MLTTFTKSMAHYRKVMTGATSLLAVFSFGTQANDNHQDEVQLWLDQHSTVTSGIDGYSGQISYASPGFSTNFSSPMLALETVDPNQANNNFTASSKKVNEANYKRLGRKLSDKLKLTLFSAKSKKGKQLFFINTVKQELVSQGNLGVASYELRFKEDKAEAHFRLAF